MPDQHEPVYAISIAAELCSTHPQTLRAYERAGLVSPKRKGSKRMYSNADLDRVRQIQRFTQEMGINLAGVEVILNLLDRIDAIQAEMDAEIRREIERVRREMAERFQKTLDSDKPVPLTRARLPGGKANGE
jgi:MerR family transcriptional regulator/heat shock protein HspR